MSDVDRAAMDDRAGNGAQAGIGVPEEPAAPAEAAAARPRRDQPWVMRTYSGHSTAKASNQLYRTNLAKGQTGLSIAFDLPTQIGYDPDSPEAAGEVGKVGVPVAHLGHMAQLLDQIPVESMNTSMTINATAGWLLGLYIANAEDHGVDPRVLSGTTQNDIVKEYLSRGTFIFPPIAEPPADGGHHRLHRAPRAQVEPDQRLQLPPPGGRGHSPPGGGLRPGHRHRRPRRRAGVGPDPGRRVPRRWWAASRSS